MHLETPADVTLKVFVGALAVQTAELPTAGIPSTKIVFTLEIEWTWRDVRHDVRCRIQSF